MASRAHVVDTSVLEEFCKGSESGELCRDALDTLLQICHRIVLTDDMGTEFLGREQGGQLADAVLWLEVMQSKSKVYWEPNARRPDIRSRVRRIVTKTRDREEMFKDMRLVEAALVGDGIILSCDDEARRLFAKHANPIADVTCLHWANPAKANEATVRWLQTGSPDDPQRTLGAFAKGLTRDRRPRRKARV